MALQHYKCAFSVVHEYLGPVIGSICDELMWGPKSLKLLSSSSNFSTATVKQALSILINFNLVEFKVAGGGSVCEYSLVTDNILIFLKYPRFLLIMRKKFGREAEFVIRELLHSGKMTLYSLIIQVTYNLSEVHSEIPYSLSTIKNTVTDLIENNFIVPIGRIADDIVPKIIKLTEEEKIPHIDMQKLSKLYSGAEHDIPRNELSWKVNFDRFLVECRDEIIVSTMMRRINEHSGVVMRHLLKLAFVKTDPWRPTSNPIPMMMIRDSIGNDTNSADVVKYTEQYIRVMEEDSSGVIGRSQEYSGAIVVCFKDFFDNLAVSCVSQVVEQKFGSKAARVFRLVQSKKFTEIEEIQKSAMLADKEAKQITYKLLEENFLQMQELRKPTTSSNASGPNKSFFLFYVDINLIVTMVIGMCYKTAQNFALKRTHEHEKNAHVIEKRRQADLVVKAMTDQKASEQQINEMISDILSPPEKAALDMLQRINRKLFLGDMQIDETIFLLQCYMMYNKTTAPETKLKKRKI